MKRAAAALALLAALSIPALGEARGKHCVEVSDLVGHEKCRRFGDQWSTESLAPFAVGLDLTYLSFDPRGHVFEASAGKHGPTLYKFDGAELGVTHLGSAGPTVRVAGYLFPSLYLGIEWGATLGRNEPPALQASGWSLRPAGGVVDTVGLMWAAFAGARLPLGRLSLRGEIFLGGRVISLRQRGSSDKTADDTYWATATAGVVEPRLAVDLWATPWVTIGGWYGRSLVDQGSQTFGLSLVGHARSYDGSFSL